MMRSQPPTGVETRVNSWGSKVLVAGRGGGKEGCWYEGCEGEVEESTKTLCELAGKVGTMLTMLRRWETTGCDAETNSGSGDGDLALWHTGELL